MSFRFIFHHAYPTLRHFVSYGRLGRLVPSRLALQHRQRITCASSVVTSFRCNLYFYCCSPEFSPFRPSSDSSSSSSHNAQNSHHEDKPKGSYFQEALLMTHCAIDSTFVFYLIFIGGAPNRPLPPTPDEEESGDRTLVMKRVSTFPFKVAMQVKNTTIFIFFMYLPFGYISFRGISLKFPYNVVM